MIQGPDSGRPIASSSRRREKSQPHDRRMLFHFSLYGFLKNQRYFEPFLVLAFLERGMSFALIGSLFGFRAICASMMEIPTGAVADVIGRRRAMIFSHLAYMLSFLLLGIATQTWLTFAALFFFSIGDAFRTGTHKAMIFNWLERAGRSGEKTSIYGHTRSWSKIGSAVGVLIGAALVFTMQNYSAVFWLSMIPTFFNIINFLGYPEYLDGSSDASISVRSIVETLKGSVRNSLTRAPLRRLIIESMGFEGLFSVSKDYLQPILQTAALSLPILLWANDCQRTALLVGAVYFALHLLSSAAARKSDTVRRIAGSTARGSRFLWLADLAAFAVMSAAICMRLHALTVASFLVLAVLQNLWRPILVSRVADHSQASQMATVLSIESQAKGILSAGVAPLLGLAIDHMPTDLRVLPIGLLGIAVATLAVAWPGDRTSGR